MSTFTDKLLPFIFGAGIAAAVTWAVLKRKYEQIAQEEIDSVKEVFSKRLHSAIAKGESDAPPVHPTADRSSIDSYSSLISKSRYTDYSDTKVVEKDPDKPYIIKPEEFGDTFGYETLTLTYYPDKCLVDEDHDVINDPERIIGTEALHRFGEYEEDSVFVRNDRLRCDYEILLDVPPRTEAEE